jgi:hypothetical protein
VRRITRLLRKLAGLDARGWRDLVAAQGALVRAQWRLRREPIGSFAIREPIAPDAAGGDPVRARQVALAVQRAAEHGLFRPYCLVQAIALRELLRREGIVGTSIRIGVRRDAGEFQAHAWVRWGDEVLGDRTEKVARFTEVDDLRVVARG